MSIVIQGLLNHFSLLVSECLLCSKGISKHYFYVKQHNVKAFLFLFSHHVVFLFQVILFANLFPEDIYLFNFNNRNTIKRWETRLKLTIKTIERRQWRRSGVFVVNSEHISYLFPMFLLTNLSMYLFAGL